LRQQNSRLRSILDPPAQRRYSKACVQTSRFFSSELNTEVKFDPLRNTISFRTSATQSDTFITAVWLDSEKIPFSKFATTQPNLESISRRFNDPPTSIGQLSTRHDALIGNAMRQILAIIKKDLCNGHRRPLYFISSILLEC